MPGHDSQARSGMDSPLTWAPADVSALNAPCRRSRYGGGGPVMPSSDTETRSRGRPALDRDGASREGGVQPPSETKSRSRVRPTLKRDGTSPEGATGPRARRSCTGAAPYPSSGAEFRPRVARPIVWWVVGPWVCFARVVRSVCVCFLRI
jgi:hypothetical protein